MKLKKQILRILRFGSFLLALFLLLKIFYPRNYNVPSFAGRAGTRSWNLRTGSRIGYTLIPARGHKKETPIIYLHGGPGGHITGGDIHVFEAIADSGYNIFLYDQIGSGASNRLSDIQEYTVERHMQDLKEIIVQINAPKVILVGQSWGAILATLFAATNPEKIEKIILACPGPIYPIRRDLENINAPDSIQLRKPFYSNAQGNKKANNIRTKFMAFFATKFGMKIATDQEADHFATILNYELNKSTVCDTANILPEDPGYGFYAGLMTFQSLIRMGDPRKSIQGLSVPVLVMKGECDNQPWGFTAEYLQLFKDAELSIIPNAGHFIAVEQPKLYVQCILGFLVN
jgi:proline iminopeptidase